MCFSYPMLLFYSVILMSGCRHEKTPHFVMDLVHRDGNVAHHSMPEGSLLLIMDGDRYSVVQPVSGNENELDLKMTQYTVRLDSIQNVHLLQQTGSQHQKWSRNKKVMLDPGGQVEVQYQVMAMMDTGRRPIGACKGICCEATCFSVFCCGDQHECKNTPCDCKPSGDCPKPSTGVSASHFFDMFRSGKNQLQVPLGG